MTIRNANPSFFDQQNFENIGSDLIDSAIGGLSPFNNFARYATGPRCIIKINDKLFGFAFGVTYNISTASDEIWTIDDWLPYELGPKRISISGTLSMFHIPSKGPARELVQPNVLSFLFHKYITLDISDQTTGQTIFKTNKAMITNKSQNITAGEISTIQLTWKAIGWSDEMTPSYPQGHNPSGDGDDPANLLPTSLGGISKLFG